MLHPKILKKDTNTLDSIGNNNGRSTLDPPLVSCFSHPDSKKNMFKKGKHEQKAVVFLAIKRPSQRPLAATRMGFNSELFFKQSMNKV